MRAAVEPLLTNSDIEAMPDDGNRYELIDGELFVSTAPSVLHQRCLMRLALALARYFEEHPIGEVLPGPGVIFDDYNGVIPDLIYCSFEREAEVLAGGDRFCGAPELVIEILSPGSSNEKRDRTTKRQLYSKRGVSEYWIVDPAGKAIEVYCSSRRHRLELVATLRGKEELTTPLLPGFGHRVSRVFAS
jgi:Uma2 family endonuclease